MSWLIFQNQSGIYNDVEYDQGDIHHLSKNNIPMSTYRPYYRTWNSHREKWYVHVCQGTALNNLLRIYRLKCSINSALGHGAVLLLLLVRSNPMVEAATRFVWANVPNIRKICTHGVEMSLFVSARIKRIRSCSKAVFL